MPTPMRYALACAALFGLAGCEMTEPYDRIGTWRPSNSMDANIALSVANPHDLVRGVDYNPRDATLPTAAIERYRTGKVRALPAVDSLSLSGGQSGGGGGNDAPAVGGTAAAQ